MLWTRLYALEPKRVLPAPWSSLFALDIPLGGPIKTRSSWLIGPYARLTGLATDLRANADLREMLTDFDVRLGLRATDTPPTGERQARYGATRVGAAAGVSHVGERKTVLAAPARDDRPVPGQRRGDARDNVRTFWDSQTPQSHHIVEYNNLRDIGVSKPDHQGEGEMDHALLPAVLLAAEFHQGYLSAFLKQAHGLGGTALRQRMPGLYRSLYVGRSALFEPLWRVSQIILDEAGLPAP